MTDERSPALQKTGMLRPEAWLDGQVGALQSILAVTACRKQASTAAARAALTTAGRGDAASTPQLPLQLSCSSLILAQILSTFAAERALSGIRRARPWCCRSLFQPDLF